MKRREFITMLGGAAAWPCNGLAQSPPKRPLIGFLGASSKATGARYYSGFAIGMRELGYVEGRDYGFEDRMPMAMRPACRRWWKSLVIG
jgi:putative tryptophan/tyrosine transport system substrate-binding protein